MTGKKLAVNVTVGSETYEAGSTPPKDVADQISNPKAFGDEPDAPQAPVKKTAPSKTQK